MKRRRLLVGSALIAAILAGGYLVLLTGPNPRVTTETFKQVKPGMTEEEVASLFGEEGRFFDAAFAGEEHLDLRIKLGEFGQNGFQVEADELERHGIAAVKEGDSDPYCRAWVGRDNLIMVVFTSRDRKVILGETRKCTTLHPLYVLRRRLGLRRLGRRLAPKKEHDYNGRDTGLS